MSWKITYGTDKNKTEWIDDFWLNFKSYPEPHTIRQIFYRYLGEIAQFVPDPHKKKYPNWANQFYADMVSELGWLVREGKVSYHGLNIFDGSGASEIIWQRAKKVTPAEEEQFVEYPVEVWVEKNACWNSLKLLFGWNRDAKPSEFRLNLISGKGFAKMQQIERLLRERRSEVKVILYVTDFDPSGLDMNESLPYNLKRMGVHYPHNIKVERIALFPNQIPDAIKQYKVRPLNVNANSAMKFKAKYGDDTYEIEALAPDQLREIVREAIKDTVAKYNFNRKTSR
jgi:hypothetical protein